MEVLVPLQVLPNVGHRDLLRQGLPVYVVKMSLFFQDCHVMFCVVLELVADTDQDIFLNVTLAS